MRLPRRCLHLFPSGADKGNFSSCDFLICDLSTIAESTDSGSASVKKDKEKKNRKKDKENGSGSGEAGNHDNIDAPEAVVGFTGLFVVPVQSSC